MAAGENLLFLCKIPKILSHTKIIAEPKPQLENTEAENVMENHKDSFIVLAYPGPHNQKLKMTIKQIV